MGVFLSTVGAFSTFYPDAKKIFDEQSRKKQIHRLIAKVPSIGAYAYRHSIGRPYIYPDNDLSFAGNFLNMLFRMTELKYQVNPVLERAIEVLFILHADHEQNCSTSAMRGIGSSHVDPYSAMAGAAAALYGPLHGGANEAVLRMLTEIGSVQNIPGFIKRVKAGEGRLMGFGHRVYKSYDPRAKIIKQTADAVFEVTGREPAARHRARARAHRAPGRVLRHPQALSERRLLLRPDLSGDGLPGDDVPGAVCDSAHVGLGGAVGRDAARPGAEDRAAEAGLHRRTRGGTTCRCAKAREASESGAKALRRVGAKVRGACSTAALVGAMIALHWCTERASNCERPAPTRREQIAPTGDSRSHRPATAGSHRRKRSSHRPHPSVQFDSKRAWEHLQKQVSFGPRPSGTPAIVETRRYIIDQLKAAGIESREQMFIGMTPLGEVSMANVIATIPGKRRDRHRARQPLRHQAVSRVPIRRRERRRLVYGGPARARPRR